MEVYDYIITGGGCAGLSLAARINRSDLKNKKLLILDRAPKEQHDKTWCYWEKGKGGDELVRPQKSWSQMVFHSPKATYRQDIGPYSYCFVGSMEFYKGIHAELEPNPNIHFRYEKVTGLKDLPDGAQVATDKGQYKAKWVFNSIPQKLQKLPGNIYLQQHFLGWFLEMEEDSFSPNEMTLMDFRVSQDNAACFVYILPFTKRKALVEYTVFSENTWETASYEAELERYLDRMFKGKKFHVHQKESGIIPMTNHAFPRKSGRHLIHIGTAGGFTKPTTGYTYRKIQEDAIAIVEALVERGSPDYSLEKKARFSFYDNLLLYLIQSRGGQVSKIFERLFRNNDFRTIVDFLDEKTSLSRELWMLLRLPWMPFLKAIWEYYLLKTPIKDSKRNLQPSQTPIHEPTIA